jgi:hypothetical protein
MRQQNEGVFNPTSSDFFCKFDADGKGPVVYTVPSRDIAYFTPAVARHIKKHLFDAIVNDRGLNGIELNADISKKKAIMEETDGNV